MQKKETKKVEERLENLRETLIFLNNMQIQKLGGGTIREVRSLKDQMEH